MKIYIPILCYNHMCHTSFMMSILETILYFKNNGIDASIYPITFDSLVSRARNAATAFFMSNDEFTHMLFIDSDIQFKPQDIIRMLQQDKDVIAAGYPKKAFYQDRMTKIFSQEELPPGPLELCTQIPVSILPDQPIENIDLLEAYYVTTGFLLIKKEVIRKMIETYPERKYINDIDGYMSANQDMFYDFFTVVINPNTKRFESEDYGFSRLWIETGGKIFLLTDVTLTHFGWYGYVGNLKRHLTWYNIN